MGYYEHVDHSKNGFAIMYLDPKRKKISWRYDDDLPNGWVIIRTKRNENAYFVILDKLVAHVVSPVRVSDRLPGLNPLVVVIVNGSRLTKNLTDSGWEILV